MPQPDAYTPIYNKHAAVSDRVLHEAAAKHYITEAPGPKDQLLVHSPLMCVYRPTCSGYEDMVVHLSKLAETYAAALADAGSRPSAATSMLDAFGSLLKMKARMVADCSRGLNTCVSEWRMQYKAALATAMAMTENIRLSKDNRPFIGFIDRHPFR